MAASWNIPQGTCAHKNHGLWSRTLTPKKPLRRWRCRSQTRPTARTLRPHLSPSVSTETKPEPTDRDVIPRTRQRNARRWTRTQTRRGTRKACPSRILHSISDLEPAPAGLHVNTLISWPAAHHQSAQAPSDKPLSKATKRTEELLQVKTYGGLSSARNGARQFFGSVARGACPHNTRDSSSTRLLFLSSGLSCAPSHLVAIRR